MNVICYAALQEVPDSMVSSFVEFKLPSHIHGDYEQASGMLYVVVSNSAEINTSKQIFPTLAT